MHRIKTKLKTNQDDSLSTGPSAGGAPPPLAHTMCELQLLHDVVPVFLLLAAQLAFKLGIELACKPIQDRQESLGTELRPEDCTLYFFTYFMDIKQALDESRGEWRPEFNQNVVGQLLDELENYIQVRPCCIPPAVPGSDETAAC